MKAKQKRLLFVVAGLAVLSVATYLVLNALNSNIALFYSPSQVFSKQAPQDTTFRLGGLVQEGSIKRQPDGVTVHFVVTDNVQTINVAYKGILPDMFREGKGVVAQGKLGADGIFAATEVLAKHDENYMPPEVAEALNEAKGTGAPAQAPAAAQ